MAVGGISDDALLYGDSPWRSELSLAVLVPVLQILSRNPFFDRIEDCELIADLKRRQPRIMEMLQAGNKGWPSFFEVGCNGTNRVHILNSCSFSHQ